MNGPRFYFVAECAFPGENGTVGYASAKRICYRSVVRGLLRRASRITAIEQQEGG